MTPLKKLETMAYQTQQAQRLLAARDDKGLMIWICSIENTARRWGPEEILNLSTRAYNYAKSKAYSNVRITLDEIYFLLDTLIFPS